MPPKTEYFGPDDIERIPPEEARRGFTAPPPLDGQVPQHPLGSLFAEITSRVPPELLQRGAQALHSAFTAPRPQVRRRPPPPPKRPTAPPPPPPGPAGTTTETAPAQVRTIPWGALLAGVAGAAGFAIVAYGARAIAHHIEDGGGGGGKRRGRRRRRRGRRKHSRAGA